jgi:hypothetical protein
MSFAYPLSARDDRIALEAGILHVVSRMTRRDFMVRVLLAASAMTQATLARNGPPRIGYLGTNIGPDSLPTIAAFRQGLRQLGYVEGQNIIVEYRWARGPADIRVKSLDSHAIKAVLVSRSLLVKIKRDLENQMRGLLKNLGLVIGRTKMNAFTVRAAALLESRPQLAAAVDPLLKAREVVEKQIADLDRKVMRLARKDVQARRFMTAPGIGPITALCYLVTIDDPTRF